MYYLVGDIHGEYTKLLGLMDKIFKDFNANTDQFIFLGDYIDRGSDSYNVVRYLSQLSLSYHTTFLRGNHEQMLYDVLNNGDSLDQYLYNGGQSTIDSYKKQTGEFFLPDSHKKIIFTPLYYLETDSFIAVHAGLNPACTNPAECDEFSMIWIREAFFKSGHVFEKTVIFGHTPTFYITKERNKVFFDDTMNIIGIDTGAVYHGITFINSHA
jgi:serine/threonine protein phosphatase 1